MLLSINAIKPNTQISIHTFNIYIFVFSFDTELLNVLTFNLTGKEIGISINIYIKVNFSRNNIV